ncbi:MAG TPA: type II secretion system protein GspC [Steroidobacteraceae bacterium]|nr:type II secretion system protein GspC [Steroidobacteraceae bacterium]
MNAVSSWLDASPTREKWYGVLKARGPQAAVWVLAIALGAQAASIVTRLAGAGAASLKATAPLASGLSARPSIDVASIAAGHLFGAAPLPASGQGAATAPQTTMPLVLTGTIAVNRPKDGLAILGPSITTAKVYAVGDNVPGGARLHAVYDDRVLLERAGRLETLLLPRKFASAPPPVASTLQSSLDRVRRVISEDPGVIADVMRPQPVFADGKQRGYRVYPGRNSQAFMSLGLRPGDLVVAINNTPLDDPARGEEIFRTLGSSSEARVTVMRNGRQQDLTLNMSEIASEADQLAGQGAAGGAGPQAPE